MVWLLLLVLVALGVSIWPLGRWGTATGGSAAAMGFWISLSSAVFGGIAMLLLGAVPRVDGVLGAAVAFGIAYSIGFCVLIMHALKIGPAGPTVAINNIALVAGVLYNWFWLNPQRPTALLVLGLAGVCGALILMGLGANAGATEKRPLNAPWLRAVIPGGAFSALSFASQAHVGMRHPGMQNGLIYLTLGMAFSALILAAILWRRREFGACRERLAGLGIAVVMILAMPLGMAIMRGVGPAIYFPGTVAMPIVVMVFVGHVAYREHLNRHTLAGCLLAAGSVALLAYASAVHGAGAGM